MPDWKLRPAYTQALKTQQNIVSATVPKIDKLIVQMHLSAYSHNFSHWKSQVYKLLITIVTFFLHSKFRPKKSEQGVNELTDSIQQWKYALYLMEEFDATRAKKKYFVIFQQHHSPMSDYFNKITQRNTAEYLNSISQRATRAMHVSSLAL